MGDTGEGAPSLAPGLYLVATPIGHARDITLRALDVLRAADVIAAEDTRHTAKLLAIHGIAASLVAYHEHNAAEMRPRLMERLDRGGRVALVSDAGTPLISDPGFKLVRGAIDAGHPVIPIPGATAPVAALVASGLATDRFLFAGFLPPKEAQRRAAIADLAAVAATLVFFESPRRAAATLADLHAVLGPRPAVLAREITKKFETFARATLADLAARFESEAPRGEVVLMVAGAPPGSDTVASDAALDDALALALTGLSVRDAADVVAKAAGVKKREVYGRAVALAGKGAADRNRS